LTHDLIAKGENVRLLVRDEQKARKLFGNAVELSVGDLGDATAVLKATRDTDIIYNIAGIYRFGLRHRRELWRINVEGAENLFRGAAEARTSKVVHLSSGGLLRKSAGSALLREDDFPAQAPLFSPYKDSKWQSEQVALAWARRGLPVVIASTTCPIGRGDEAPTPTGQMVHDFLNGRFPFYCHTALNFIDVRDLSAGLQAVAERGKTGRRYLLANENLWLKEFLDLLTQETDLPAPRWCLPNWTIQLAGCGGEVVDWLNPRSTGARICLETAAQARHAKLFDNSRTRRELNWEPRWSIQESIRESVAWFRNGNVVDHPINAPAELEASVL